MRLFEKEFSIPALLEEKNMLSHLKASLQFQLHGDLSPVRMAITESNSNQYRCEFGVIEGLGEAGLSLPESIFEFSHKGVENTDSFNAVLLVPTGIGSEIGGHAGDATPIAKLMAQACDTLITHPNVVNASDINEAPENSLYVEGSVISRFLMGSIGLQRVRSNRVLVVIDAHKDELFANAAINAVSAARASFGLNCPKLIQLDPPVKMSAKFTQSGRAVGEIENLEYLIQVLEENREDYDAIALSSVISVPHHFHQEYFDRQGTMTNPWGGVEAMLTHTISSLFNVPSAHSPMFESQEIANANPGVVEPRMAAEAISLTFLQCIFKGLQKSPKLITDKNLMHRPGVLTASDVSCLVIPDGCLGLPTLAALEQGITVIAVKENKNLMNNDLSQLPWVAGQFYQVENYLEAVGLMNALKAGITVESVRRPLKYTSSEILRESESNQQKKMGS